MPGAAGARSAAVAKNRRRTQHGGIRMAGEMDPIDVEQSQAAINVQRHWRGFLAKREFRRMMAANQVPLAAATSYSTTCLAYSTKISSHRRHVPAALCCFGSGVGGWVVGGAPTTAGTLKCSV